MAHFERDAICLSEVRCKWLLDFAFVNLDDARNEWSEHALHHFHRQYLEQLATGSDAP